MEESKTDIEIIFGPDNCYIEVQGRITEDLLKDISNDIVQQLKVQQVEALPVPEEIDRILRHALQIQGQDLKGVIVAEGTRPTPPKNGEIQWTQDFFSENYFVDEKTGSIDYRRKAEHRQVQKNQLLCRVKLPVQGVAGKDVFGKTIKVGKPKSIRIISGPNVRRENTEEETLYYAETDGRIRWLSNTLSIDETYQILGDVDLETGNIQHSGALVIGKDVKMGAKVTAAGDIQVGGMLEPSDIQSQGNLIVRGGITGSAEHRLDIQGNVHAKFIQETTIEAGGDIFVQKEILHSRIRTSGKVIIPGGDIIGGSVQALGEIDVKQTGGPGFPATLLVVGEDFNLVEQITTKQIQIDEIKKKLDKIHFVLDPMMSRMKLLKAKQKEAATALLAKSYEMEEVVEQLKKEIENLKQTSRERAGKYITIRGIMYPETTLRISGTKLTVKETQKGPLRASVESRSLVLQTL